MASIHFADGRTLAVKEYADELAALLSLRRFVQVTVTSTHEDTVAYVNPANVLWVR